jgi:hypothetical protein
MLGLWKLVQIIIAELVTLLQFELVGNAKKTILSIYAGTVEPV